MKKHIVILLPFLAVTLAGCSLPTQPPTDTAAPADTTQPTPPQGFSQQIEKGSVWKSNDGGKTFVVKSTVNEQSIIEKADVLSMAFHPTKPGSLVIGSVDNGIFKTDNGGETWTPIVFPPKRIYSFILDRRDPDNRMFASGVVDNTAKIFRSDDGGANWNAIYTEPGLKNVISSLAQDPRNPDVLYAGTSTGTLVKSTDAGETWRNMSGASKGNVVISEIGFDAQDPGVVYLLLFNKEVRLSKDGGETWVDFEKERTAESDALQKQSQALRQKGNTAEAAKIDAQIAARTSTGNGGSIPNQVLSLTTDPSRTGVLYAGTPSGLYRSTDFGKYWEQLNIIESAKKFPIRAVAVDPKNPSNIVFSSGNVLYRSGDSGATWTVTPLSTDRTPYVIAYDPLDSKYMFLGLRKF
ncbi:MAG: hypothetical protein WCL23_02545 [Candidatus Moraniibacteriota bacterium]